MTFTETNSALSLIPRERKNYRACLALALLASLAVPSFSVAAEPPRCAAILQSTAALPGRAARGAWTGVKRYGNYLAKDYGPAVYQTYGGRLIMRDADTVEPPSYLRPLKSRSEIGLFRRIARSLNPAHHIAQIYLGWPRDHSFHPIGGTLAWFRYRAHQATARLSNALFGRPLQFTLPVLFGLSGAVMPMVDQGLDRYGEYRAMQDVKTQAQSHQADYLNLARTDFRYHDIATRYANSLRRPMDAMKASVDVRVRLGFYDIYYNQGLREEHLKASMSEDDLDKLMGLSFFHPLDSFRQKGIPTNIPGYRLLLGASSGPISDERLGNLVLLVDRLLLRYQIIEEWASDQPNQYRLLRMSPTFGDLTVELDQDSFAQELLALHHAGKLNALQLKLAEQEWAYDQTEFEKCKVLHLEKIDIVTGKPVDIKAMQAEILRRVIGMPNGMF